MQKSQLNNRIYDNGRSRKRTKIEKTSPSNGRISNVKFSVGIKATNIKNYSFNKRSWEYKLLTEHMSTLKTLLNKHPNSLELELIEQAAFTKLLYVVTRHEVVKRGQFSEEGNLRGCVAYLLRLQRELRDIHQQLDIKISENKKLLKSDNTKETAVEEFIRVMNLHMPKMIEGKV